MAGLEFINPENDTGYGLDRLPGRKKVQLYWRDKGLIRTVAWFRDDADADQFLAWLSGLVVRQR